ncbi:MAG: S8 family serine peptidase [Bacteroidetes bacterium]|nr:MAG: S8 family serine peptidase [Bacteroidota bacterium]
MRTLTAFVPLFLLASAAFAGELPAKYWIHFTDRAGMSLSRAEPAALGVSERAVRRRAKVGLPAVGTDDLPAAPAYLDALRSAGARIENTSRWFNAVSARLTPEQAAVIARFPFVRSVEPVRSFTRPFLPEASGAPAKADRTASVHALDYGPSLAQMTLINAVKVHDAGVSGRGVLVGMLDSGFRWKVHEALQGMKVLAEYDFIQKDTVTANEGDDRADQDSHGTSTMSLVGAYKPGQLISPAYNAYFMLGKTEYVPSETNVEEDNWVAGIEWMEANGADVVSSSLGYNQFDAGQTSYVYADMNGRTAKTTVAAAIAARKGVVVVNSMGNEGNTAWKFLTAPADADSIISVGAVNGAGTYASFSSTGPTSDGRTKPDVAAHGVGTYSAVPPGKVSLYSASQQGTSLATPLVAGVAAMLLSARPELTPVQVREALRATASNASAPNNTVGWGIVNAYAALLYHGLVAGTDPAVTAVPGGVSVALSVLSPVPVQKDSIRLYYSIDNGASFNDVPMTLGLIADSATNSGRYAGTVPGVTLSTDMKFYVRAKDQSAARTAPYGAPAALFSTRESVSIVIDPPAPRTFALKQNYPNPFNPATLITFYLPKSGAVRLAVYDLLGREVAVLAEGYRAANTYTVRFDGTGLASGVYLYRLTTETFAETRKMVMVR